MILPFVRDMLADVAKSTAFSRAAAHLKASQGRLRLSGLTDTAKLLICAQLQHAIARPLILLVANNRAAEELLPVLQSFCELSGAASPDAVVYLPARDVLPFENLSPHPEIQEARAKALWRVAGGGVSIVVAPFAASAIRLHEPAYYRDLGRVLRRGESLDLEQLVTHLNTVGYARTDVVEMTGEYASRGGILDIFPPESERPLRLELFGDEIESIRRFDPATQRSSGTVEEAVLLPLTETPVSDQLLGAIHARLSGRRISGTDEALEEAARNAGVTVFPGWEFYASVAGATQTIFDHLPNASVLVDEPVLLARDQDAWWERLTAAHERSGVGNLVRPEELFLPPESWRALVAARGGADIEQLGVEGGEPFTETSTAVAGGPAEHISFSSRPTTRFHGSMPAMIEEVKKLTGEGERVLLSAGSQGELERLADIFNEYGVPYRLGSRAPAARRGLRGAERIFQRRPLGDHAGARLCAGRRGPARVQAGDLRLARSV